MPGAVSHVVIMVQENHTTDNYFRSMAGYGANVAGGAAKTLGDGLNTALNEAQDSAGGSESSPDWIPDGATSKIPSSFGEGKPTQKGEGWRWNDGKGNGIRIILRSISKLTTLS